MRIRGLSSGVVFAYGVVITISIYLIRIQCVPIDALAILSLYVPPFLLVALVLLYRARKTDGLCSKRGEIAERMLHLGLLVHLGAIVLMAISLQIIYQVTLTFAM